MIVTGPIKHLAVDIIFTAEELDEIIKWYGRGNTEFDSELLEKIQTIHNAMSIRGVKRIGTIDESRLNWN
jgi:hypothetical protein